jgi:hypothetical protein
MLTEKTRFFAQFTPDQLRAGYARNVVGLRFLLAKAEKARNGKANGFTADQLRERVAFFDAMSRATDEEIRAHVGA